MVRKKVNGQACFSVFLNHILPKIIDGVASKKDMANVFFNVVTPITNIISIKPSLCKGGVYWKAIELDLPEKIFDLVRKMKFPDPAETV